MKKRAALEFFKNKSVYIAYFCTISLYCLLCALVALLNRSGAVFILAFEFFDVLYAVLGAIAFALWCKRDAAVALGLLIGSLTPLFAAVFI